MGKLGKKVQFLQLDNDDRELKEFLRDTALYTIVIPSTSSHPTLLKRKYEFT
jgi:hypothetical protein